MTKNEWILFLAKETADIRDDIQKILTDLFNRVSSAQQWIPVSEGLPPSREEVIVSICDETGDTRYNYTSHGWLTTDKEYWIVDNEINNYVVAWMPLPEPWKGEKR